MTQSIFYTHIELVSRAYAFVSAVLYFVIISVFVSVEQRNEQLALATQTLCEQEHKLAILNAEADQLLHMEGKLETERGMSVQNIIRLSGVDMENLT